MINDIFSKDHIILDSNATTKQEVLEEISKTASKLNIVSNEKDLLQGFLAREEESTTELEQGFAIPHSKSDKVLKDGVFLLRLKKPVLWNKEDNISIDVVFGLAVRANANNLHIKLLSKIATSLLDANFRKSIKEENNKDKIVGLLNDLNDQVKKESNEKKADEVNSSKEKELILAVSACPAGIAHTYMAASNLKEAAKLLGYDIKVETHGAGGIENKISNAELKKAKVLISACDINIPLDRFKGVPIYETSVGHALKKSKETIKEAISLASKWKPNNYQGTSKDAADEFLSVGKSKNKIKIMKDLMYGCSYMIPIVVTGGILLAISLGLGKAIYGNTFDPSIDNKNVFYYLFQIGVGAFTLMIPILGGMIAHSIAGKGAFAPALIVSYLANTPSTFFQYGNFKVETPTGFLGAIFFGIVIGYTVKWVNTWKVPVIIKPVMPLIITPLFVTLIYGAFVMFGFGAAIGYVMSEFKNFVTHYWDGNIKQASSIGISLAFGLLLGAMIGFDMGGPFNKIAFLTASGLIAAKVYTPMGACACAIPVAPLGMGLYTIIFRKICNEKTRSLGKTALTLGCVGISEGAIPFAIANPKRVIVANVVGSCIAGGLGGILGIGDVAAHGGPIIGILNGLVHGNGNDITSGLWGKQFYWTLIAFVLMGTGALITAFICGFWTIYDMKKDGTLSSSMEEIANEINQFRKERKAEKIARKDTLKNTFSKQTKNKIKLQSIKKRPKY